MELMLFDETKFNQAVKLAGTLAKSSIVPKHFQGHAEDVFACLVLGAELGFQPMQALNSIVMIQGNATLKAQTMLALVRAKCPKAIIKVTLDEPNKRATCFVRRDETDDGYTSVWDFQKAMDAKFAQAWDKDLKKWEVKHNWKVQPTNMAKWRAISECLRVVFPDVIQGLYSTEEMEDVPPLRNDPLIDLQQAAREDAERMRLEQLKPEDSIVGPLFLIQNGSLRGTRLWQMSFVEIEEYLNKLISRKTPKKEWELELINVFTQYLESKESYYEMILELQSGEE
jgi:RecT family